MEPLLVCDICDSVPPFKPKDVERYDEHITEEFHLEMAERKNLWDCAICNTRMTGRSAFETHISGKKHTKKKKKIFSLTSPAIQTDGSFLTKDGVFYKCECGTNVNTLEVLSIHKNSTNHRKAMAKKLDISSLSSTLTPSLDMSQLKAALDKIGDDPKGESECQIVGSSISDVTASDAGAARSVVDSYRVGRGFCLIINQETYLCDWDIRTGTQKDVLALEKAFKYLNFEVCVRKDLKRDQIETLLDDTAKDLNFRKGQFALMAICILSHGKNDQILGVDLKYVENIETKIVEIFGTKNCPGMADKPKLFILNACRGERPHHGVLPSDLHGPLEVDSGPNLKKVIPTLCDYHIVFSTLNGNISFRHKEDGSIFIQQLCWHLNEMGHSHDYCTIMEMVRRQMSEWSVRTGSQYKMQIPEDHSTLVRKVYFETRK